MFLVEGVPQGSVRLFHDEADIRIMNFDAKDFGDGGMAMKTAVDLGALDHAVDDLLTRGEGAFSDDFHWFPCIFDRRFIQSTGSWTIRSEFVDSVGGVFVNGHLVQRERFVGHTCWCWR